MSLFWSDALDEDWKQTGLKVSFFLRKFPRSILWEKSKSIGAFKKIPIVSFFRIFHSLLTYVVDELH